MEESETERRRTDQQLVGTREEADSLKREKEDQTRENDRLNRMNEMYNREKQQLESHKTQLQEHIGRMQGDLEVLMQEKHEWERDKEKLESEKEGLSRLKDKYEKDLKRCDELIQTLENKNQEAHAKFIELKEKSDRQAVEKDVLENEKNEMDKANKSLLETQDNLHKHLGEMQQKETELTKELEKNQTMVESLGQRNLDLTNQVAQLDQEKNALAEQKNQLLIERSGINRIQIIFLCTRIIIVIWFCCT